MIIKYIAKWKNYVLRNHFQQEDRLSPGAVRNRMLDFGSMRAQLWWGVLACQKNKKFIIRINAHLRRFRRITQLRISHTSIEKNPWFRDMRLDILCVIFNIEMCGNLICARFFNTFWAVRFFVSAIDMISGESWI